MDGAWIFQKPHEVRDLGPERASWYLGWYEPSRVCGPQRREKSFGPGEQGKRRAVRFRHRVEGIYAQVGMAVAVACGLVILLWCTFHPAPRIQVRYLETADNLVSTERR